MKFVEINIFFYGNPLKPWKSDLCWSFVEICGFLLKFWESFPELISLSEIPLTHLTVHYTPVCRDQHAQTHWYTYSHIVCTCIYTYTLVYGYLCRYVTRYYVQCACWPDRTEQHTYLQSEVPRCPSILAAWTGRAYAPRFYVPDLHKSQLVLVLQLTMN